MRKRSHSVSVGMCFVGGGGYQENDSMHQIPDCVECWCKAMTHQELQDCVARWVTEVRRFIKDVSSVFNV